MSQLQMRACHMIGHTAIAVTGGIGLELSHRIDNIDDGFDLIPAKNDGTSRPRWE